MRFNKIVLLAAAALASLMPMAAKAADITTALAAGVWSQTSELSGDTRRYVNMTLLNGTVSNTARLVIPSNFTTTDYRVTAYVVSGTTGGPVTLYEYPTSSTFKLVGGTVAYTNAVSDTRALGSATGTVPVSSTVRVGANSLVLNANVPVTNTLLLQVQYVLPSKCRWPLGCN